MPLTLKNAGYVYQAGTPYETAALKDVSLEFNDGEYVAIVGSTGSGKSTLVQHLNGLLKPTTGHVYLDGQDIHDKSFPLRDARRQVGLVFQYPETQLFEETVEKDIAFGPRNFGLPDSEVAERVTQAMNAVGLDDSFRELSPFELSGGNIRRCALAGILAMRPRFLVLDEPTAGLDPAGRFQILQMVAAMNREGTGIIMVTHNMDDAAAYADRIIVMDRGAVAMDDTPSGIFTRTDEIVALGLDVPFCVKLGAALRSKGIVFPAQIVREGETAAYLTDLMSGKGGTARA